MTAYLEINLKIRPENRSAAAEVYAKYRGPFLGGIEGAQTKQLLVREEDVQVLHGFEKIENARAYLKSDLFSKDVVKELKDLLEAEPDIRIYDVAG
ncbi:MAG: hypothetical protein ACOWYE_10020 [Desulfatiglandales bacterium]